MKTEIITIGDEILLGQILDSNAKFISEQLAQSGIDVVRITTIGDGDSQIVETIREALERSELIITTGGLGPTDDDITKYALCKVFNRKIEFHADILELIKNRYERRGVKLPEMVNTQADLPESAVLFDNPIGSAVGILLEKDGSCVISLPGVPMEMKAIMTDSVIPFVEKRLQKSTVLFRNVLTFGTFEAFISDMLDEKDFTHEGCALAFLPSVRGVNLRLTYKGDDKQEGKNLLDKYVLQLKDILGDYFVSDNGDNLVETTSKLLIKNNKTISTAESCTGGMIASRLTDIAGSSEYFTQSVITYSNQAKTDMLGVPQEILVEYGAVSEKTVYYMAEGMRNIAGTDYAISVSGIAGPSGGTKEKPVGLIYIGLSSDEGTEVHRHVFGKDRHINRERAVYYALNYLRLKLVKI